MHAWKSLSYLSRLIEARAEAGTASATSHRAQRLRGARRAHVWCQHVDIVLQYVVHVTCACRIYDSYRSDTCTNIAHVCTGQVPYAVHRRDMRTHVTVGFDVSSLSSVMWLAEYRNTKHMHIFLLSHDLRKHQRRATTRVHIYCLYQL